MRIDVYQHPGLDERSYTFTIRGTDLARAKFRPFDRMLLNDVDNGEDVTIADRLLALELIARRVEEAAAK